MKFNFLAVFLLFFALNINYLICQTPGGDKKPENEKDTVMVFVSPRPLISAGDKTLKKVNAYGLEILFSESGFGAGFFWQRQLMNGDMIFTTNLGIGSVRNTDEFDEYNSKYNTYQVTDKINRIYKFPLTFGLQYFVFKEDLSESLQPFISLGAGPTLILSNPYTYDRIPNGEVMGWFKSFSYGETNVRLGGSIGIGAYFGNINNNILSFNIKYFYIPYGGAGIVSLYKRPIQNLGGIQLSLSIGNAY